MNNPEIYVGACLDADTGLLENTRYLVVLEGTTFEHIKKVAVLTLDSEGDIVTKSSTPYVVKNIRTITPAVTLYKGDTSFLLEHFKNLQEHYIELANLTGKAVEVLTPHEAEPYSIRVTPKDGAWLAEVFAQGKLEFYWMPVIKYASSFIPDRLATEWWPFESRDSAERGAKEAVDWWKGFVESQNQPTNRSM